MPSEDVFILDNTNEVWVWIGAKASANEKKSALQTATNYLVENKKPIQTPVMRVVEGAENEYFLALLD